MWARLFVCALICACADDVTHVVQLPERAQEIATVVVVREYTREVFIDAYNARNAEAIKIEASPDSLRGIYVLHYAEELAALPLVVGRNDVANPGDCGRRLLPEPHETFQLLHPTEDAAFQRSIAVPEVLIKTPIRVPCPCVSFDITRIDVGDEGAITGVLPQQDGTALLCHRTSIIRIDHSGMILDRYPISFSAWACFQDTSNQIWIGAPNSVYRGTLQDGFVELFGDSAFHPFENIDGSDTPPLEVYALAQSGEVFKLTDSSTIPEQVVDRTPPGSSGQFGKLVWQEHGRVVATQDNGHHLLWYDASRGVVQREEWPDLEGDISVLDKIGGPDELVLSTRVGSHFLRQDGRWQKLGEDRLGRTHNGDITPYRGGFLQAGESGFIGQYHPDAGFCEEVDIDSRFQFRQVAVYGEALVVAGTLQPSVQGTGLNNQVFLLQPK